jgi:hypothetical protein
MEVKEREGVERGEAWNVLIFACFVGVEGVAVVIDVGRGKTVLNPRLTLFVL